MNDSIELKNLEIYEFCKLNKKTGKITYYKKSKIQGFTGLYFRENDKFLGLYPTKKGPMIYYKGNEYELHPKLDITHHKDGKKRKFCIHDYNIEINYTESPYIGFDVWSDEIDVDLLFMIEQSYKDQSFYEGYILR